MEIKNPSPTTGKQYDALTEEEKIAWVAEEIMGWSNPIGNYKKVWIKGGVIVADEDWNPLESWDDWRQVEEKIMKDGDLEDFFVRNVTNKALAKHCLDPMTITGRYLMKLGLPTKLRILYISYHV